MASSTQREAAQRTATYVQAVLRSGNGQRRRKQPPPQWPWALEREYASDLVGIIKTLRRQTDAALAHLPALIESARRERADAADRELLGLHVVIENPAGSIRTWIDADGTTGQTVMKWSYGYLDGFEGADGEDVDVYVGPELEPAEVYVVHQQCKGPPDAEKWPDYDEDKVMLGWPSADAAKAAYLEQYDDPRFFGGMSVFAAADFKHQLVANPGRKLTHADPRARVFRLDVGEGRRSRVLMDLAREGLGGTAAKAEHAAGSVAKQVDEFGKKQLGKQSAAALGVDITPLLKNPKWSAKIDGFVHENVALVKTLGSKSLDDLEKLITRALADGKRASSVGAEISKRWGIAERHARLIARDQIGKLNGQLTRARHEELGIAQFRWLTMNDPLVRPTHKTKEGKVYSYKGEGTPPFFPGEEVCCRCGEEPLFDDILGLLDSMMTDATPAQSAVALDTSGLETVRAPAVPVLPGLAEEVVAEHARAEAARAAAIAAAKEDLVAFNAHTAKEKVWADKVQAAKEKQAKALDDLKAKMAAELAAKKAQEEAAKAAQEATKKAALAAQQAAELAAKKAASAAKAAATRAANKAKKAALASIAPAPAAPPPAAGSVRYSSRAAEHYHGFHGQGFVQDADAIEGGSVRVVKVNGHDGEYFEAVFKVTTPFGDKARTYGTENKAEWIFRQRETRNGVLHDLAHSESMPNASRVRRGARAGNTVEIGTMGALNNQVRIRAKSLAELDAQMTDFSKHVGLDLQKEPTREDIELQAKARLAAKFDPATYGSRMQSVTTPEQHRQVIEEVFAAQAAKHPVLHDALKDVRVEEVYPGHKTLYSESLGKHLGKQWKAMYHDGNPPAELAAKIVGDTGLMSSVKRYNSGVFTTGMSTNADFRTGGADGVFMRVAKTTPSSAGGRFRAVIDTTKVMGRMDWWAFNHDNYGRAGYREYQQRWSVPEQTAPSSRANSSNEVMAPHGVPPSAFKKFIVSDESYRQRVLAELRKMGVTQINGQSVDEFVTSR